MIDYSGEIPGRGIRQRPDAQFAVAVLPQPWRPLGMGAKYLPTDKDMKASRRFIQKTHTESKFIRSGGTTPTRKPKPAPRKSGK